MEASEPAVHAPRARLFVGPRGWRSSLSYFTWMYTKSWPGWSASRPVAEWQPTQIDMAGPLSPGPLATMPSASCGAPLESGTSSYQYQLPPRCLPY